MWNALHAVIGGSSPITGYLGSLIIVLDVAQQAVLQGGVPQDLAGWFAFGSVFLTGLGIRFAKDANKTNAPNPTATQVVRTIAMMVLGLSLTGCGKTLDQLKQVAHQAIEVAGKVYEDVQDNVETAKKTLSSERDQ